MWRYGTPSARLRHDDTWDPYTALGGYLTSVPRLGATTDGATAETMSAS